MLADGGEALAGRLGLVVIAAAALLATASAVNATIFAASNISYDEARKAELSRALSRTVGRNGNVALLVSGALVVVLVLFFPLAAVGQMTSLAFLIIYGAVSVGHLRVRDRTGGQGLAARRGGGPQRRAVRAAARPCRAQRPVDDLGRAARRRGGKRGLRGAAPPPADRPHRNDDAPRLLNGLRNVCGRAVAGRHDPSATDHRTPGGDMSAVLRGRLSSGAPRVLARDKEYSKHRLAK